jgi:hypothetical protein
VPILGRRCVGTNARILVLLASASIKYSIHVTVYMYNRILFQKVIFVSENPVVLKIVGIESLEQKLHSETPLRSIAKTEYAKLERREAALMHDRNEIDLELAVIAQLKKTYSAYVPTLKPSIDRRPRARRLGQTLREILLHKPNQWLTLAELQDAVNELHPGLNPSISSIRNAMAYVLKIADDFSSRSSIHGIQYTYSE